MKMKNLIFFVCIYFSVLMVYADSPFVTTDGVGTRALGLGNNYTALASDYSAVFWNPAGLAFIPIREVSVGIGGLKINGDTKLSGSNTDYSKTVMQLSNIGLVRSLPTTRGGFAFALGYSTPYDFNDLWKFRGKDVYMDKDSALGTLHFGDTLYYDNARYYSSGNLGMWSASAGWQVTQGLGFGGTLSLLNGTQKWHKSILTHTKKGAFDDGSDISSVVNYVGFDLRLGGLYQVNSRLSVGARIELPRSVKYKEKTVFSDTVEEASGSLKSSLSGALGIATMLSFATISADVTFRSPNSDVDEGDLAYWKIGAGAGLEVPIQTINAMLRAGYSWKELDSYPYADYINNTLQVDKSVQTNVVDNVQMFTCGITFILSKSITFDAAYAYSHYSTETVYVDWQNVLSEEYSTHRGTATVSIKY
jgi:hypothetical protein